MSRSVLFIAILCLPFTVAAGAGATGSDDESSEFGLGGRYSHVTNRRTDEGSEMGGVVARLRSNYLGIEGAVDYRNQDLSNGVDLKTWPATASLLVFPIRTVYGLAGVGWYNSTLDFASDSPFKDQTASDFGFHFGAGVEIPVDSSVRLTGDFRYQFIDQSFDDVPDIFKDVDEDAFALNAGVLLYF